MRSFLASLLLFGSVAVPLFAAGEPRAWLTSVDQALAQAAENDQRILVDLYADWCGWCKRLEEDVFSTPIFQQFASDFVLLRVDTEDGGEGSRLQQRYEAYSLPTTLVLEPNRVMVAAVKGFAPAPQYVALIEQEIARFEELRQGFDRHLESDDPRVLGILADEFHRRADGDRAANLYRRMIATERLTPQTALRIRYQLSDALRVVGHFEEALDELDAARRAAHQARDLALVQRFELLAAQILLDRGDCDGARTTLEAFLGSYPSSNLGKAARRTLKTLDSEGYRCI